LASWILPFWHVDKGQQLINDEDCMSKDEKAGTS